MNLRSDIRTPPARVREVALERRGLGMQSTFMDVVFQDGVYLRWRGYAANASAYFTPVPVLNSTTVSFGAIVPALRRRRRADRQAPPSGQAQTPVAAPSA